jgi:hypothetical protein
MLSCQPVNLWFSAFGCFVRSLILPPRSISCTRRRRSPAPLTNHAIIVVAGQPHERCGKTARHGQRKTVCVCQTRLPKRVRDNPASLISKAQVVWPNCPWIVWSFIALPLTLPARTNETLPRLVCVSALQCLMASQHCLVAHSACRPRHPPCTYSYPYAWNMLVQFN